VVVEFAESLAFAAETKAESNLAAAEMTAESILAAAEMTAESNLAAAAEIAAVEADMRLVAEIAAVVEYFYHGQIYRDYFLSFLVVI